MVLTMAAVAANKEMSVSHLSAVVEGQTLFEGRKASTRFSARLDLGSGLSARERRILFNSARQCEVHKMLQGEIRFVEALEDPESKTDPA